MSGQARLPAHLEVAGLIRAIEAAGGFAAVIARGERDAGTILFVSYEKGGNSRVFERMPQADGSRNWALSKTQNAENPENFEQYLARRRAQDPDVWVLEADIAQAERFIGLAVQSR